VWTGDPADLADGLVDGVGPALEPVGCPLRAERMTTDQLNPIPIGLALTC
jgi:hypothetical protein